MKSAVVGLDSFVVKQVETGAFKNQQEAQEAIVLALTQQEWDRRIKTGRAEAQAGLRKEL